MITYIQLNDLGYLDVKDEVAVPLNFSIAEIQDISKRQGGFSKTIKLAGTSNNNNLLGHLFDVNIADASFNINVKQRCQIIQNGVSVFDGYLQLLNVNKLSPSSGNPDEFVEYDVQVKDDSGNFYSSLQEKMLEDLPYWSQYNHIYTLSAITATSAHTVTDGYTYMLPFKANTVYGVTDFTPAIYAKAYWDRIFLDAGYTYEWDSLEDCNFDKLIIPYNGDTPLANNNFLNSRVGFTTGSTSNDVTLTGNNNTNIAFSDTIEWNDDTTFPNYNNSNNFNVTTFTYDIDFYGSLEVKTKYDYRVTVNVPVDTQFFGFPLGSSLTLRLTNLIRNTVNLQDSETLINDFLIFEGLPLVIVSAGTYTFDFNSDIQSGVFNVSPNDIIKNFIKGNLITVGEWYDSAGVNLLPPSQHPTVTLTTRINQEISEDNFFNVAVTGNLFEGQLVNLQSFIPKQIKQKDFINGIVKMFNLYITPDKFEENHLIIQTRDDYYDSGSIIDWTNKFVLDSDAQIEFLPDLQDKRLILTYKQDNDEWNKQYLSNTGEVYGQVQYEFENEFTQSTKKIENIFSPTPIINNTNGLLVPAILAQNPKTNIRILYYDGWKDGEWSYVNTGTSITNTFDSYPRALHFDDPINPTIDINFAQPDAFNYSSYQTVTNNNLYNRFWSRFINQIETGKLLKGTFLLDENDIHNLDLRSKVWLHDCYWNINRIIDYNPNGNGLTKVELISVDEGLKFAPYNIDRNNTGNTITDVGIRNNWITNLVSINDSQTKNSFGTTVVNTPVFGQNNVIQSRSQSTLVLGNGNRVSASDSIVIGQNNSVQGNNMFAFGNNITVTGDSQAVFNVPLSATVISATTLYVDGSPTPIEPSVWAEGTGAVAGFAIKALNDSTTDATGDYAVAQGFNTLASGEASHAEGANTTASGLVAHAEGLNTQALGDRSHAEGFGSLADGDNSHAEGFNTQALGDNSHAGGRTARALFDGEFAHNSTINTGAQGNIQFGIINAIGLTTNATPVNIGFNLLGTTPFTINNNCVMGFNYIIIAKDTTSQDVRLYTGRGLLNNISGTHTLVFASTPTDDGDASLATASVAPIISGGGLVFEVTGLPFNNIVWSVRMDYSINR